MQCVTLLLKAFNLKPWTKGYSITTFTATGCPTLTWLLVPAVSYVSATSCYGKRLIANSTLPRSCGQTSGNKILTKHYYPTAGGNGASGVSKQKPHG